MIQIVLLPQPIQTSALGRRGLGGFDLSMPTLQLQRKQFQHC